MPNSNMALSSSSRGGSCRRLLSLVAVLTSLSMLMVPRSHGQEIGRLYATRPPPGYAFVRIATLSEGAPPRVQVNSENMQLNEATGVSYYRAVPGNQPLSLVVNGSTISKDVVPGAAAYLTLVIAKPSSEWTVQSIDEGQNSSDGLKAKLRFFNLAPGCTATLKIAEGPTIFQQAPFASVSSRTINPVTAKLEGSCEEASASLTLPQLHAGDYYSLFLRKEAERLRLTGQLDETEPYRER
ncbi:alginate O-acetyltransferase AlgF [Bradyrhizobium guangdongense]|nr:alginate O-acetyltransferase AlgF [Bradyrhizobium guangdongense]